MNGQSTSSVLSAVQPKMWKDLNVEEKLERMREQIKYFQSNFGGINGQIQDLKNDFQNHNHLDGKVVKDIKTYNGGLLGVAKLSNPEKEASGEVYF